MACEVAPRVTNKVEGEWFLVADEVENAGGAARVAALEFAVEYLGAEAEGHGNGSGLAGLDGEGLGFGFAGCGEEGLGFFGEISCGKGFGGAVFFCGEGAECGDAGELLGRERRAEGFACSGNEGAGGAALDGDHAGCGEIFQGIPSRGVEDLEGGLGSARPGVFAAEGLDFIGGCRVDFVDDGEEERGVLAGNPGLLAMLETRAKGFAGPVGKVRGGVGNGCGRRGFF